VVESFPDPTAKPKEKTYFPFTDGALQQMKFFAHLATAHTSLRSWFADLIDKIDRKRAFPQTIFNYKTVKELGELAVSDKHNVLTRAVPRANAAASVTFADGSRAVMSPIFQFEGETPSFDSNDDAAAWVAHGEATVEYITEHFLVANNWEIGRFCDHAVEVSWRVLEELYGVAYGQPAGIFNPHEQLKPPAQRRLEEVLRGCEPVHILRLMASLKRDGGKVFECSVDFTSDQVQYKSGPQDLAIALIDLFWLQMWPAAAGSTLIRALQYFEVNPGVVEHGDAIHTRQLSDPLIVTFDEGKIHFDEIRYALTLRFGPPGRSGPPTERAPHPLARQLADSFTEGAMHMNLPIAQVATVRLESAASSEPQSE